MHLIPLCLLNHEWQPQGYHGTIFCHREFASQNYPNPRSVGALDPTLLHAFYNPPSRPVGQPLGQAEGMCIAASIWLQGVKKNDPSCNEGHSFITSPGGGFRKCGKWKSYPPANLASEKLIEYPFFLPRQQVITKNIREALGIEEPYWNRSISLKHREELGLFLERKSKTGVEADILTFTDFKRQEEKEVRDKKKASKW